MKLCVKIRRAFHLLVAMAGGANALGDLPGEPEFLDEQGDSPGLSQILRHAREQSALVMG